ncbi:hypothetical protein OHC33_001033 [Knufia fluminis]|uniref:DNA replication factor Cdt1 C-terminal domain-containing protein n=1 Tax=Knufia fluminis TaxID=191047 RepID=A0AAN8I8S2_9EURO|nr:hypothetical protein OHC33_001033 [Knufia fluminis]
MAPSSRNRISKPQARPENTTAFRITKSSKLNVNKQKLDAIEEIIAEKEQPQSQPHLPKRKPNSKKRRRDAVDSDAENEEGATQRPQKALRKVRQTKLQLQILTPPASSPEPEHENENEPLPETLEELKSLHKSFTQALGVHYAHNGTSNAVSLAALMPAMTRLWKRRTVSVADVERMLAVWEVTLAPGKEVEHSKGPFRLVATGIGSNAQAKVEYAWTNSSGTFIESELHQKYEAAIERVWQSAQVNADAYSFVYEPLITFPRLKCQIGTQTQARREKITSIRDTILSKQPQPQPPQSQVQLQSEPDFSKLQISDPSDNKKPISREETLKSRTTSLFDRLRAKQAANNTSAPQTSATLLRRRALHRIPEIIDILRLKQSQKLNSLFRSDLHGLPNGTGARKMKVSFSLESLVQEIRDSGRVLIAAEEIRECIVLLGREVPDGWCSVYLGEGVKCVTLQGEGWRKEEVRGWCEGEVRRMDGK